MTSVFDLPFMRLMTYNLKNGGDIPHWERRKNALLEVIREQQPVVVGTQEGMEFQLAFIRDGLGNFRMYGEGRDPILGGEYCAVFVNEDVVTVQDSGTFWLSPTPTVPGSRMPNEHLPRVATWVRMQIAGVPLLYINTHLTYIEDQIPAQMAVLAEELATLIDPTIETIISGDFNIGRHREPMESLRALGFVDAWSIAQHERGPRITFPDWDLWSDDRVASATDENRIDWVCIRPADGDDMPSIDVETVHTHRAEPVPSDHFPVVVSSAKA